MANKHATQGRLLINELRRKPHTYMDMLRYGISISPWKRIKEALAIDERIEKSADRAGRTTWRVRKISAWPT